MESDDPIVYEFYDGDFTFHVVEYEHSPERRGTFRVRLDADPETRATENESNFNAATPGWTSVRPATPKEIAGWFSCFRQVFPTRREHHTEALRALRECLETGIDEKLLTRPMRKACEELALPIPRVREFLENAVAFVGLRDGVYHLTEEGRWLTTLMR